MKKIFLSALACAMVSLVGCDQIEKATTTEIDANAVKFNFSANVTQDEAKSSVEMKDATLNSFSETRTVLLSELGSEVVKYADKISKVVANSSLLRITVEPEGNYTITNLTVAAVGLPSALVIPSYTLGDDFTAPPAMKTFTEAFVMRLISTGSVEVTVSGQTDAPTGAKVNVVYENDLLFTAKLLK